MLTEAASMASEYVTNQEISLFHLQSDSLWHRPILINPFLNLVKVSALVIGIEVRATSYQCVLVYCYQERCDVCVAHQPNAQRFYAMIYMQPISDL